MSPVFASYFEPFFVCQTVSLGDSLFENSGAKVKKDLEAKILIEIRNDG
jgi:hypothetical protein